MVRVIDFNRVTQPITGTRHIDVTDFFRPQLIFRHIYKSLVGIARIDPATGQVKGWIDMRGLLDMKAPHVTSQPRNHVLNGIAYHPPTDRLYVTGKMWNTLYQVRIKGEEAQSNPAHVHLHCHLG